MKNSRSSANGDVPFSAALNETLQVRIPDDPNPVTYYSRVLSVNNGVLTIPWPTDRGIRLITHPGEVLEFYFIRGGTPHAFRGLVEAAKTGLMPQLTIVSRGPAQQVQRRQNFRIKCLLPIEIVCKDPDDPDNASAPPLVIKTVSSDISAGGLSFRYVKRMPEGMPVAAKLSLPDDAEPIRTQCIVIYSDYASEFQTLYRTALRFTDINEGERSRIVRFVYRLQLQGLRP